MADLGRVSDQRRRQMIAEAAYLRAEKRGFTGGDPVRDWMEAEREVDAHLQRAQSLLSLEHLEAQLASANKKLKALSKKISAGKADVQVEWQRDLDKLAKLRDTFEKRLEEFRKQSGKTAERTKKRAEKVWEELADALQKVRARRG